MCMPGTIVSPSRFSILTKFLEITQAATLAPWWSSKTKHLLTKRRGKLQNYRSNQWIIAKPQPARNSEQSSWSHVPHIKEEVQVLKQNAKFVREQDHSSWPSEEHIPTVEWQPYVPPLPVIAERRSLRHSQERSACLIFAQYWEIRYPDHLFCDNCKEYTDCINSGAIHGKANQNSCHFRCTAYHTDYFLPYWLLFTILFKIVQKVCKEINVSLPPCAVIDSVASSEEVASTSEDELPDDLMLLEDFQTLQVAFDGAQQVLRSSYVNSQLLC